MRARSCRETVRLATVAALVLLIVGLLTAPNGVKAAATQSQSTPTPVRASAPTATPTPTPTPSPPPPPLYYLPWPNKLAFDVEQGNHGAVSHRGQEAYAWDFLLPLGSLVLAARGGRVAFVEQSFEVGGPNFGEFGAKGNHVVVDHGDGTSAVYLHLMHNGSLVKPGDPVAKGQPLAYSGATGFAFGPHLHFQVELTDHDSWFSQSIPASFFDVPSDRGVPQEGQTLPSGNLAAPPGVPLTRAAPTSTPSAGPHATAISATGSGGVLPPSLDARYLDDLTVPDGTSVFAGQTINKRWRLTNPGALAWPVGATLVKVGGDSFGASAPAGVPDIQPGATTEISLTVNAPLDTGVRESVWQMAERGGATFGDRLWIRVNVAGPPPTAPLARAISPGDLFYSETGHNIVEPFARFFTQHGGLDAFGYPRTDSMRENGLTVQYFQRVRFELHSDQAGTPYEVQAALLGDSLTADQQPFPKGKPFAASAVRRYFPQTGHGVQFAILKYFDRHGGVDALGYPISDELPLSGAGTIQYFQRARLEYHPERAGTPDEVQSGLLGDELLTQRGWLPVPQLSMPPASLGSIDTPHQNTPDVATTMQPSPSTTHAPPSVSTPPNSHGETSSTRGAGSGASASSIVVTAPTLHIREQHNTTSAILATAKQGAKLQTTGQSFGGWIQVLAPGTSTAAWVDASYTTSVG